MSRRRVEAFLTLADEEFRAARLMRTDHPRQAVYFLQQATEKLARAVLEVEVVPAGRTHDLAALAALLPPDHVWRERLKGFADLSAASTRYRYPSPTGTLARVDDDLDEIIERVGALKTEIEAWIGARLTGRT